MKNNVFLNVISNSMGVEFSNQVAKIRLFDENGQEVAALLKLTIPGDLRIENNESKKLKEIFKECGRYFYDINEQHSIFENMNENQLSIIVVRNMAELKDENVIE